MTKVQCKQCGCTEVEIEEKGNHTGIYCKNCGIWIKWASKDDLKSTKSEQETESEWIQSQYHMQCQSCSFICPDALNQCPQCKAKMKNAGIKCKAEDRRVPVYLPCSANTKLYTAKAERIGRKWVEKVVELKIDQFIVSGFDGHTVTVVCCDEENCWYRFGVEDFGDSVFFSEEEVQKDIDENVRPRSGDEKSIPFNL